MSRDLARTEVTPQWKPEKPKGKRPRKPIREKASPARWEKIRAAKCQHCLACGTSAGHIHGHHMVERGSPHFGSDTENNIIGLCAACHEAYHSQGYGSLVRRTVRERLTKDELDYIGTHTYDGWVDNYLWRLVPVSNDEEARELPRGLTVAQTWRDFA